MRRAAPLVVGALLAAACSNAARDKALAQLKSGSAKRRAEGTLALGRIDDDDARAGLVHAARDPSPLVRKAAADALASARGDVVDSLGGLLGDRDESVRAAAAAALAKHPGDKSRAYLLHAFGRSGRETRAAIVLALAPNGATLTDALKADAAARRAEALRLIEKGKGAQRGAGVVELGRLGGPEALTRLGALLPGATATLAIDAATGLGESGDREALSLLRPVLRAPEAPLRAAAAEAIAQLGGDDEAIDALVTLATTNDEAAAPAVRALAATPTGKKALDGHAPRIVNVEAAEAALEANVNVSAAELCRVHTGACWSKGLPVARFDCPAWLLLARRAGPPESRKLLEKPLQEHLSENQRPSADAARAVGALGIGQWYLGPIYDRELRSLEAARAKPPDGAAPPEAEWGSLKMMLDEGAVDAGPARKTATSRLTTLLAQHAATETEARPGQLDYLVALAHALAETRAPGAEEKLLDLSRSPSPRLRAAAAWGLARLGTKPATERALALLTDVPAVRAAALPAALTLPPAQAATTLAQAARADDPALHEEAALALAPLASTPAAATVAIEALVWLLQTGDTGAPLAAISLGRAHAAAAVPALAAAIDSPRAAVAAVEALASIGGPAADAAVVAALLHDDAGVRIAACRAAHRLPAATATLAALAAADPVARVRQAAR